MASIMRPYFLNFNKYVFSHHGRRCLCRNYSKHLPSTAEQQDVVDQIFPDIEGSPKPVPANYFKMTRGRKQKSEKVLGGNEVHKSGHIIIECKNKDLNHYINQKYNKFNAIPLATKGWNHRLSKGDYFKINIYPDKEKRESVFWVDGLDSFESLGLDNRITEALKKMGITKPTHIQASGIPAVLNSQNVLLAGETGCGKTLAYLLPVVQEILRWRAVSQHRKFNTPLALVLTPGRELAYQIGDVVNNLAKELMFDFEVMVGGHMKRLITHPNFRPVDLFVSSIGAAGKLTTSGLYNMSYVRHIVMDEADTCMDDSFSDYVVRYLKKFPISYGRDQTDNESLPPFCQLTLVSATMPTSLPMILEDIIVPESLVKVETPRLHQVLVHVPQMFLRLGQSEKPSKLLELAKRNMAKEIPTIIFSNRSKVCDWVSMFLNENGISCVNLNGDMPTDIRRGVFDQFQRGFVDVISCTDIASRGLDTVRAKHIINYDFPIYMADYIHRCGRVGRVGHTENCHITNFVSNEKEVELAQKVETAVRTMSVLPNVNGNITRVIQHKKMKYENII
ncbi:probable ATP-dependent RNA helicase DDX28 [Homalodisca vitripennis]|uniref:probable ATP-dependent RNA helicase DDX28 n=1 Tax=Homalodisca vitripennis TaxID=197043 RepID=UPI001EEC3501|nr:probable ATP-dependent RNA helicase DDX28 [Homalodisca vitripennis]